MGTPEKPSVESEMVNAEIVRGFFNGVEWLLPRLQALTVFCFQQLVHLFPCKGGRYFQYRHTRILSMLESIKHGADNTYMTNHPKPSAKNAEGEFTKFKTFMTQLMAVPHSKIKAALDAEKQAKVRKSRTSASRALNAKD